MHARQSRGGREEEERPLPIRSRADHASRGLRSYQEAADWPEDKGKLTFLCPWPLVAGKGSGNTGFGEDRGRPQWIERRSHSQLLDAREKVGIPRARVTDANSLEAGTSPKSAKKMFCGGYVTFRSKCSPECSLITVRLVIGVFRSIANGLP
ncbi:hypothetical protein QR680_005144 [Steinernema hermaphroditum]|uniref:Uncharacterized protein n=1 Tax=Steinernema hermaphroditum TaxID=289476 RepID=A0AA39HQZ9_9BILA|nr:hypothetical protein QR680_005144 [Steinernema hermaphroditum]